MYSNYQCTPAPVFKEDDIIQFLHSLDMDILIEDTNSMSMGPVEHDDDTYEPSDKEKEEEEEAVPQVTVTSFLASQNRTLGSFEFHK